MPAVAETCILLLLAAGSFQTAAAQDAYPSAGGVNTESVIALNAALVFFMQVGFVALETGSGRAKNVRNILLKNMVDVMLCTMCWWFVGYGFAYGKSAGGVIGISDFAYEANTPVSRPWFFSLTFALACVTIVSGCLAERTRLPAYPIFTAVISLLVAPILSHWIWNSHSWLNNIAACTVLDFAGGTVVHMIGGLFGIVGAAMCGPRLGRFEGGATKELPGHDMAFVTLGTFMLWFGWYGFNVGSVYLYAADPGPAASRVSMNTTLAASAGGLAALAVSSVMSGTYDLRICCNGVLSGLAAITPMCGFVAPWAAVVAGTLAGIIYCGHSRLLLHLKLDDPLDSAAVHYGNGALGMLLLAFVAQPEYVKAMVGTDCGGIFFTRTGWLQLGMQVLAVSITIAVTVSAALLVFWLLKRANMLRVDQATELAGIDLWDHGGPAYPEFTAQGGGAGSVHNGRGV